VEQELVFRVNLSAHLPLQQRLENVASARCLLLCASKQVLASTNPEMLLSPEFSAVLKHRPAAIFLLKLLARDKGVAFVRSWLNQEPIPSSAWMRAWIKNGDQGLIRCDL
jgi:hypothetical protein